MSLDIRPMAVADLGRALDWAASEGWNPGLDDAWPFHAQDPSGFLMGWLAEEPVGCISVVKYGPAFAFLGLYIVLPAYRGQGHGKAIWDAGVASAGARTIGLDGVPAQQDNYRKSGFAFAYASSRWTGSLDRPLPLDARVRLLDRDDFPFAAAFDSRHIAATREPFIDAWLASTPARLSMGYFDGATLRGYGTIRRCRSGWKVGPLFAETPAIAEALLASLLNRAGGEPVSIDIPRPNAAASELARRLGFAPAFDTARMYKGPAPALPIDRIYGTTTLELG